MPYRHALLSTMMTLLLRGARRGARRGLPASAGRAGALLALGAALGLGLPARAADAAGYPTADRVVFVQACMRDHPGNYYEMINKCSCAIDRIAQELSFEDYTTLATLANALSIGGERGSTLRDNEAVGPQARRFRELQAKAKRACFVMP